MWLSFKKEVESLLSSTLQKLGFPSEKLLVEQSLHADLSSRVAFILDAENPEEKARIIKEQIKIPRDSLISNVRADGPYLNFFVSTIFLERALSKILSEGESYGSLGRKGKVIIEHTSANPDGPLHIGHIRSGVIGDTLARVFRKAGYDTETHYYVNDMGRQIAVLVWGWERFGKERKKKDHMVADIYVAANQEIERNSQINYEIEKIMREYEKGNPEIVRKFKEVVDFCLDGIKETLGELSIHHDEFVWESNFVRSGDVGEIIERIGKSRYARKDGNALLLDLGLEKELVLLRKDGTSLYPARDLAYHEWKSTRCEKMIDVLGADHRLFSNQLGVALEELGIKAPDVLIYEFVSLPSGAMSSREGKYISADELMEEVEREAFSEVSKRRSDFSEEERKRIARAVSRGAIRYDMVKISPEKPLVFDWKLALDFERQTAPYIQYAHVRVCSILRKAKVDSFSFRMEDIKERAEENLIKRLSQFPMFIQTITEELSPSLLASYARDLADDFNEFYRDVPVLSAEKERETRIAEVEASRIVLKNVLELLGIEPLQEM